jgi:hypothetical protein
MRNASQSTTWAKIAICALLFSAPRPLHSQTGWGTILGRVTDQSGAVVPGAQVSLRNEVTNVASVSQTNVAGDYTFSNVIPNPYQITVAAKGFQLYVIRHVILGVGQTVRQDAVLPVGATQSSVEVIAEHPLVQTDTTSVGSTIHSKQIESMPLDGRINIFGLLALAPGVQSSGTDAMMGGQHSALSAIETLDGSPVGEIETSFLGRNTPSLDSIAEFQVITTGASAKYAGAMAIIMASKSGTNQYHGSAFEYNRITALAAKDFFATRLPNPPLVRNEFGASLGGPIKRDKLFFFGSFEGLTNRASSTLTGAMPTQALLNGDFSGLSAIKDPTSGVPFSNNQIPATQISPISKAFFQYYPTPNVPTSAAGGLGTNYVVNKSNTQTDMRYEGRADYAINDSNKLMARYYMVRNDTNSPGITLNAGGTFNPVHKQDVVVNYTRTVSSSLVNLATFSFHTSFTMYQPEDYNFDARTLIPGLRPPHPDLGGVPSISITGFTGISDNGGSAAVDRTSQFSDDLTWVKGKHVLGVGFTFQRWWFRNWQNAAPGHGAFSFTRNFTNNTFGDFLLGDLATSSLNGELVDGTPANLRYRFYVQDDWKATSRLTLNIGLRYDLPTLYQNITGNMANWYPDLNKIVVLKGRYNSSLYPGVPIVEGSSVGLGPGNYIGNDRKQFGPRLGFAYRPLASSRLVLRAGGGLYYQLFPWVFGSWYTNLNPPFNASQTFTALPGSTPTLFFANPFPVSQGALTSGLNVNAFPKQYRYPMVMQWNFTLEYQLSTNVALRATYLGSEGEHLTQCFPINEPPPGPGVVQTRRPYQPFGAITLWENGQTSNSQQLQLAASRRFSSGLSFAVDYSWTKTLNSGGNNSTPSDNRNIRLDRGNDPVIRQHYLQTNYVYELPFGRGRRFLSSLNRPLNAVLGGWGTAGMYTLASGAPFSVTFSSSVVGWPSGRADIIGNPHVSDPTITRWFDAAAFSVPQQFAFGNSAPNSLFGPGYNLWSTTLYKQYKLGEKFNLRLQGEAINVLNHPSFGKPNSNISTPAQVGRITGTSSPRRSIEFSLRLTF